MNCEICKVSRAQKAIFRELEDGSEEELYVCDDCAAAEKRKSLVENAKKFPEASITVCGDVENAPPFIGAIINAMNGVMGDIEAMTLGRSSKKNSAKSKMKHFPAGSVAGEIYKIDGSLHLEGLFQIGEIEAAARALHALDMDIVSKEVDGIKAPGHLYDFAYSGSPEDALKLIADLVTQEKNARVRLLSDMKHIFADSVSRALAILKNCRLLAPGEYIDLLSPLRLAVIGNLVTGITREEIDEIICKARHIPIPENLSPAERDAMDIERASSVRALFEGVFLSPLGKEVFQ